jgi:hypothetical protein
MEIKASHVVLGALGLGAAYLVYREVSKPAAAAEPALPVKSAVDSKVTTDPKTGASYPANTGPAWNDPMIRVVANNDHYKPLRTKHGQRVQILSPAADGKWEGTGPVAASPNEFRRMDNSPDTFVATNAYGFYSTTVEGSYKDVDGSVKTAFLDISVSSS